MCVLFSSRTRTEGVTSLNKILSSKIVSEALMGRCVLTISDYCVYYVYYCIRKETLLEHVTKAIKKCEFIIVTVVFENSMLHNRIFMACKIQDFSLQLMPCTNHKFPTMQTQYLSTPAINCSRPSSPGPRFSLALMTKVT